MSCDRKPPDVATGGRADARRCGDFRRSAIDRFRRADDSGGMNDDTRPAMILSALADPTRRAVLDRLRDGPLPVAEIARPIPVSRPAVSQHLRVLLDAGLVAMTARGTRNIYALAPGGAGPLVGWLGDLSARDVAEVAGPVVAPGLRRDVTTRLTQGEAWTLFCEDIAVWWPVARVSLSALADGALPQAVTLDLRPGGRLTEVLFDGTVGDWASVTEATNGLSLALDWALGLAKPSPVPVRVTFAGEDGGSRITLATPDESVAAAAMWDAVLERFAAAANSSLSNF